MDLDYFKAIQGGIGLNHRKDVEIRFAKRRFADEFRRSINYIPDAKRNGVVQPCLVSGSDSLYKADITVLPDDELYDGDMIECFGEHWIVTGVKNTNPLYKTGLMWMCNQLFRFQNFSSRIIERWGVLDSGVYSTTLSGDYRLRVLDKQYKVYLPYDEDTKMIAVDKRFATSKGFNNKGEPILTVYEFTGVDPISKSYEMNGHLLVMNARSAEYVPGVDNYDEMICDYIPPTEDSPSGDYGSVIVGTNHVGIGKSKSYSAKFMTDGIEDTSAAPIWTYDIPEDLSNFVTASVSDRQLHVNVANNKSLIGKSFTISVVDTGGRYTPATMEVEVSVL